jgi:hypothetical protein
MRTLVFLLASMLSTFSNAEPAQFDIDDTHILVIRPIDSWDPNKTTAEYSLNNLRSKSFGFQYIDAFGARIIPRSEGIFSNKVATPLSDDVFKIMASNGFGNKGSHVYFVSAPVRLEPAVMGDFIRAQNQLYRSAVKQQGDPTTLSSRIAAKKAANLFATVIATKFGMDKFGTDTPSLSQWSTLYSDISKLTGGASTALLPIPLPDYDFSGFQQVDIRRVTDNAGHVGEIIIGYRNPKSLQSEQIALAHAIAAAGGVGTTVEEVESARKQNYEQRLAIWSECQSTPACAQQ